MGQGNNCETTNMTTGVQLECHSRTRVQTRPENRSPAAVPRHEVQDCFVAGKASAKAKSIAANPRWWLVHL